MFVFKLLLENMLVIDTYESVTEGRTLLVSLVCWSCRSDITSLPGMAARAPLAGAMLPPICQQSAGSVATNNQFDLKLHL